MQFFPNCRNLLQKVDPVRRVPSSNVLVVSLNYVTKNQMSSSSVSRCNGFFFIKRGHVNHSNRCHLKISIQNYYTVVTSHQYSFTLTQYCLLSNILKSVSVCLSRLIWHVLIELIAHQRGIQGKLPAKDSMYKKQKKIHSIIRPGGTAVVSMEY